MLLCTMEKTRVDLGKAMRHQVYEIFVHSTQHPPQAVLRKFSLSFLVLVCVCLAL